MNHEDWDTYVIPPNFIEGGTLLGGLFKTRNVIEAGILALLVGIPVLGLNLSLTTRVIILCVTALPLALVALIGVSGGSLSSFLQIFFTFLRNRRVLTREGQPEPEGARRRRLRFPKIKRRHAPEEVASEGSPPPRSRLRYQVDFKEKKVTQFKTFLPPDDTVKPLNEIANYIPIEKVEHGIIYTRDHRYVKLVEVIPVNFLLRSAREQRSIIYSFVSYLKIAPVKIQFKALTRRADINRHMETVRRELAQ